MSDDNKKETRKLVVSKVITLLIVWLPQLAKEILAILTGGN